jgi:hypothetical protein
MTMGLLGGLKRMAGAAADMAALSGPLMKASTEGSRLATICTEVRAAPVAAIERFEPGLAHADELARTLDGSAGAFDGTLGLAGLAQGDRLRVLPGSTIAGRGDVSGTAVIETLTPTEVKVAVDGTIGSLPTAHIRVGVDQLAPHWAEFGMTVNTPLDGFVPENLRQVKPLLAHIDASDGTTVALHAVGANSPVSIQSVAKNQVALTFAIGDQTSRILLGRA